MSGREDEMFRRASALDRVERQMPAPFTAAPVVTGSTGGNAALASLLAQLDALGIIDNQTT